MSKMRLTVAVYCCCLLLRFTVAVSSNCSQTKSLYVAQLLKPVTQIAKHHTQSAKL